MMMALDDDKMVVLDDDGGCSSPFSFKWWFWMVLDDTLR